MKTATTLAVAAAVTAALTAASVFAAEEAATEKCYGVAKAGKNDCTGNGVAGCAGSSIADGQGFIMLPKGLCERLKDGSITDPTKK